MADPAIDFYRRNPAFYFFFVVIPCRTATDLSAMVLAAEACRARNCLLASVSSAFVGGLIVSLPPLDLVGIFKTFAFRGCYPTGTFRVGLGFFQSYPCPTTILFTHTGLLPPFGYEAGEITPGVTLCR